MCNQLCGFPLQSLSVNIALASPLLSRFDLVLVLLDTQNEDWDRVVSSYILEGKHPVESDGKPSLIWSMDKMQAYISLIKTINPELTPSATRYGFLFQFCLISLSTWCLNVAARNKKNRRSVFVDYVFLFIFTLFDIYECYYYRHSPFYLTLTNPHSGFIEE